MLSFLPPFCPASSSWWGQMVTRRRPHVSACRSRAVPLPRGVVDGHTGTLVGPGQWCMEQATETESTPNHATGAFCFPCRARRVAGASHGHQLDRVVLFPSLGDPEGLVDSVARTCAGTHIYLCFPRSLCVSGLGSRSPGLISFCCAVQVHTGLYIYYKLLALFAPLLAPQTLRRSWCVLRS